MFILREKMYANCISYCGNSYWELGEGSILTDTWEIKTDNLHLYSKKLIKIQYVYHDSFFFEPAFIPESTEVKY